MVTNRSTDALSKNRLYYIEQNAHAQSVVATAKPRKNLSLVLFSGTKLTIDLRRKTMIMIIK
jgi:BarA-like signal transduction histidine kinase